MATVDHTPDPPADLPTTGPTTRDEVKTYLRIPATEHRDDDRIDQIVAAVNTQVRLWRIAQRASGEPAWPANIVQGATMLAGRLVRRDASPSGVEALGTEGGAVYVLRRDPDIALLLELGSEQRPAVG